MKNIGLTLAVLAGLIIVGIVIGWFWHKSTCKPTIIELPGQTVQVTQWKTKIVTVKDTIFKEVTQIIYQDSLVYVHPIVDTIIDNTYQYKNFLVQNGIQTNDLIAFKVQTSNQIQAFADTLFNNSYLNFKENVRIRDFVYQPAPIEIDLDQGTKLFQLYGNALLTMQENQSQNVIDSRYTFTPYLGVSGIIAERYKVDIGASLNSFYGGIGIKFLEF